MMLPLVALLLETAQVPVVSPPSDAKPVRVWLDSDSPLRRGAAVRVYVAAGTEGNLVVLHRRTDGRIGVLFPADPRDDAFMRPGTYEIRGRGDRAGLVIAEPDGTGMILAALSPDPLRVNEFVRLAAWNEDALVPAWGGEDAEGALSDIVQRMLGDGVFNYDLVTYTVAPPLYAQQDTTLPPQDTVANYASVPPCPGCTYVTEEFLIFGPAFFCDGFFDQCVGGGAPRHRDALCPDPSRCAPPPTPALAYTGPRPAIPLASGVAARGVGMQSGARTAPAAAGAAGSGRSAAAPPRAVPLVPRVGSVATVTARRGLPAAPSTRRRTPYDTPLTHVRFTLVSAPASEQSRASAGTRDVAQRDARSSGGLSHGGASSGGAGWVSAERAGGGGGGRGAGGRSGGGPVAPARSAAPRNASGPRGVAAVPVASGAAGGASGATRASQAPSAPQQLALRQGGAAGGVSARGRGGSSYGGGGRR
jgi:Domain of unknown function (DUF4384)